MRPRYWTCHQNTASKRSRGSSSRRGHRLHGGATKETALASTQTSPTPHQTWRGRRRCRRRWQRPARPSAFRRTAAKKGGGAGGGEANLEAGRASFGAPTCTLKRLEHLRTTPTRAQSCASCTSEGRAQARLAPAASPARPTLATSSGRFVEKMDCMVDQSNAPSAALCTPNSMTSWAKHSRCTPGMSTGGAGGEERSAEEAWGKGSRHAGT